MKTGVFSHIFLHVTCLPEGMLVDFNHVLFVKNRLGPVTAIPIYHHLPIVKGISKTPPSIDQPMGKGHRWIYLGW